MDTTIWIGLTGGLGSGKSQAAACFSKLGIPVILADKINQELITQPHNQALQQIRYVFGNQAIDDSGNLNRSYMRKLIFNNSCAKIQLEKILHPLIIDQICKEKKNYLLHPYGIIEIPTLVEHPIFQKLIDRILVITSSKNERIKRVERRDNLTQQEILSIINAQTDDKHRLAIADDIIQNSGSLTDLKQKVFHIHNVYLKKYSKTNTMT